MNNCDKALYEIYYWPNTYNDDISFANLFSYLQYIISDYTSELMYQKTNKQVKTDLWNLLNFLVNELNHFYIQLIDECGNEIIFNNIEVFRSYINKNNINIYDEIISNLRLHIIMNQIPTKIPTYIPTKIKEIFPMLSRPSVQIATSPTKK